MFSENKFISPVIIFHMSYYYVLHSLNGLSIVFGSFVKKVKMGKRIEKAFAKDGKTQSASGPQSAHEDDPNRTPGT